MESKVKNSISQQAERAAVLSEHSRVYGKKAWEIKNKVTTTEKQKSKDFPTALEQKHSSCTSSIHGLEVLTYTFNKECRSGRHTSHLTHLPSTCVCVVLESDEMNAVWNLTCKCANKKKEKV